MGSPIRCLIVGHVDDLRQNLGTTVVVFYLVQHDYGKSMNPNSRKIKLRAKRVGRMQGLGSAFSARLNGFTVTLVFVLFHVPANEDY